MQGYEIPLVCKEVNIPILEDELDNGNLTANEYKKLTGIDLLDIGFSIIPTGEATYEVSFVPIDNTKYNFIRVSGSHNSVTDWQIGNDDHLRIYYDNVGGRYQYYIEFIYLNNDIVMSKHYV